MSPIIRNYTAVVLSLSLLCVVAVLKLTACGSSSSGGTTPTSTTASFPSSVGVDVSAVSSTDLQSINFSVSKSGGIPSSGTMTAPITTATNMADIVNKLGDHIFSGISTAINSALTSTSTQVSGTAFGGTVKIDFANYNYDIDGDGVNDPCSGTASVTSTQVACFRVWFNSNRFLMGFIQTVPSAPLAGKGKALASPILIANATEVAAIGMGSNVMTYMAWDNTTASANSFDGYTSGTMATGKDLTVGRIISAVETSTGKTTLKTAAFFATPQTIPVPPPIGNTSVDQVLFNSQFFSTGTNLTFEDDFFLAGVAVATAQNNIPFCGVIATGDPASGGNPATITACTTEGLSLTGMEYPTLSASDASKTVFPAVAIFPAAPTF